MINFLPNIDNKQPTADPAGLGTNRWVSARKTIADALELCLSCTNPSIWCLSFRYDVCTPSLFAIVMLKVTVCYDWPWLYQPTQLHCMAADALVPLTLLTLDNMAAISQTIFADAFLWMKSFVFWLKFHWSLFLRPQWVTGLAPCSS